MAHAASIGGLSVRLIHAVMRLAAGWTLVTLAPRIGAVSTYWAVDGHVGERCHRAVLLALHKRGVIERAQRPSDERLFPWALTAEARKLWDAQAYRL